MRSQGLTANPKIKPGLLPFLCFLGDEFAEVSGRARSHGRAAG
jgi:hypothetical protein